MNYRARYDKGALRIIANNAPDLEDGETVFITIERGRSANSHKHQFAWVKDAWENLPESVADMPWAETPDTLRKHALIATGYFQTYTIDCGSQAAARRVLAALRKSEAKAEGYAIGQVRGPVVQIWTPRSQSYRAMGGKVFQESKTAIMEWIADKIGVTADQLRKDAS